MSSISRLSSATQSLLQVTPHAHGRRHGSHVKAGDSADDATGDLAAPVPAGTQQSLLGGLLSSLQRVLGIQLPAAGPAAARNAATATPNKVSVRA